MKNIYILKNIYKKKKTHFFSVITLQARFREKQNQMRKFFGFKKISNRMQNLKRIKQEEREKGEKNRKRNEKLSLGKSQVSISVRNSVSPTRFWMTIFGKCQREKTRNNSPPCRNSRNLVYITIQVMLSSPCIGSIIMFGNSRLKYPVDPLQCT